VAYIYNHPCVLIKETFPPTDMFALKQPVVDTEVHYVLSAWTVMNERKVIRELLVMLYYCGRVPSPAIQTGVSWPRTVGTGVGF
jgi:hypothetical protein